MKFIGTILLTLFTFVAMFGTIAFTALEQTKDPIKERWATVNKQAQQERAALYANLND